MVKQIINTGTVANDGTGDTMRVAGRKINENFSELYTILGGDSAAVNPRLTRVTDSGLDFVGSIYRTKLGFVEGGSTINIDLPATSGTLVVSSATQTLTNKTISVDDNTISGIAASSFVLSNGSGNINGSAAQKAIPTGVVVGTTDTQTLTNKTLTTPVITNASVRGHLRDSNSANLIHFQSSTSAVNHFNLINAATGQSPKLSVIGGDANISVELYGAGTGAIEIRKVAYGSAAITGTGTASSQYSYIRFTGSSTSTVTIPNGNKGGEIKVVTHDGGAATLTIAFATASNFAQGTTIALDANDTVQLIWNSTTAEWNIIGGYGYAVS